MSRPSAYILTPICLLSRIIVVLISRPRIEAVVSLVAQDFENPSFVLSLDYMSAFLFNFQHDCPVVPIAVCAMGMRCSYFESEI